MLTNRINVTYNIENIDADLIFLGSRRLIRIITNTIS